jgi:hypothetical protein
LKVAVSRASRWSGVAKKVLCVVILRVVFHTPVASGVIGIRFHRFHRGPLTRAMVWKQTRPWFERSAGRTPGAEA